MNCRICARTFVCDGSPLALDGWCMRCRITVDVACAECGNACKGLPDGILKCLTCRNATYAKVWLYGDTTGGRLWRHNTTGLPANW